jgi:hypothetical protein
MGTDSRSVVHLAGSHKAALGKRMARLPTEDYLTVRLEDCE